MLDTLPESEQPLPSSDQAKILLFFLVLLPAVLLLAGALPALFLALGILALKKNRDFSAIETSVKLAVGYAWICLMLAALASAYYGRTYFAVISAVEAEYASDPTSAGEIAQRDGVEAALSSSLDWHSIYTARATGVGVDSSSGLDWDLRNLDLAQFEFKYGSRAADLFGAGLQRGSAQNWAYLPSEYAKDSALLSAALAAIAAMYIFLLKAMYLWPLRRHKEWVAENGIFSKHQRSAKREHHISGSVKIIQSEGLRSYSASDELLKWAKLRDDGVVSEEEFQQAKQRILQSH